MLGTYLMDKAIEQWWMGIREEKAKNVPDAIRFYKHGCELMLQWLAFEKNPQRAAQLKHVTELYVSHVAELKKVGQTEVEVEQSGIQLKPEVRVEWLRTEGAEKCREMEQKL